MAADRQIIDMERLLIRIFVKGRADHIVVGLGPVCISVFICFQFYRATALRRLSPVIPQIRMRKFPAVHILVEMIPDRSVSQPAQRISQRKRQPRPSDTTLLHTHRESGFRIEPGKILELPARGARKMQGRIKVLKYKSLM